MHYCLRYDSRAFWPSWVSGSLKGVMPVPLHVLVVLLCSAYMSSCSLHFLSFSVRFIAHSVCDTVWYYFIIFQLHCLGSFLAVVGLVGVFSVHHFAGSCGEQTFLDLTIAGVLPQTCTHCIQPSAACQLDYFWLCLLQPCHLLLLTSVMVMVASSAPATSLCSKVVTHTAENSVPAINSAVHKSTANMSSALGCG